MKIQRAILSIAAAVVAVTMGADAQGAEERSSISRLRCCRNYEGRGRD